MRNGLTTATYHILTPYPGTGLYLSMQQQGRLLHSQWDLYDTRHVVYKTRGLSAEELKAGYDWSYKAFYSWRNIARASVQHPQLKHQLKHFFYASGWKKFEPIWNFLIKYERLQNMRPVLEAVLSRVQRRDERHDALSEAQAQTKPILRP